MHKWPHDGQRIRTLPARAATGTAASGETSACEDDGHRNRGGHDHERQKSDSAADDSAIGSSKISAGGSSPICQPFSCREGAGASGRSRARWLLAGLSVGTLAMLQSMLDSLIVRESGR